MAGEAGDEVEVPPTLKALLAARLDQLDPAERRVLERGAVEGEVFHRGAVQALGPEEAQVTPRLAALVRRELIRPDTAQFAGGWLPLPPSADPRRRLRRAPEVVPGGAARALRGLAGAARRRAGRAGRDPRLSPRAGRPLPQGARTTRRATLPNARASGSRPPAAGRSGAATSAPPPRSSSGRSS